MRSRTMRVRMARAFVLLRETGGSDRIGPFDGGRAASNRRSQALTSVYQRNCANAISSTMLPMAPSSTRQALARRKSGASARAP